MLVRILSARTRLLSCLLAFIPSGYALADGALPDSGAMMSALGDELERAMKDLVLQDLPRPYMMQYHAQDRFFVTIRAAYGGLLSSDENRFRAASSRVRVGSSKLDNTNFGRGFGARATLPLDDDFTAIRHAVWKMTDTDYKRAIETLTRKESYLKQKNVEDRPDDFSEADPVRAVEPSARIDIDREAWEEKITLLSARFKRHPAIQDSNVSLYAGAVNQWIVNSEGTRLRTADTGVYVKLRAELQSPEGMRLSDGHSYLSLDMDGLPPLEKMLEDVDTLSRKLIALSQAPVLEHYTGPVLFDAPAAGKVFESLLADGLCARPDRLGGGGWGGGNLEKKIGLRVLPRSFSVRDDPGAQHFEDVVLAGAYSYDDEAVASREVLLVDKGMLKTLLASRAPTRKIKRTNAHGRSVSFGDARANIGCLYISSDDGVSSEELKQALIRAADEEGLEFGLRIERMEAGGKGNLGDPIYAYKVFVDDGREELIRGMEFASVETRALKHILAGGKERKVYNSTVGLPSSIISPAILLEELELNKIEREFDKLPILKSPAQRGH